MNKGHCFTTEGGSVFRILNVYTAQPPILMFLVNSQGHLGFSKVTFQSFLGISWDRAAQCISTFSYHISSKSFSKSISVLRLQNSPSNVGAEKTEVNQSTESFVKLEFAQCSVYFLNKLISLKFQKMFFNFYFTATICDH